MFFVFIFIMSVIAVIISLAAMAEDRIEIMITAMLFFFFIVRIQYHFIGFDDKILDMDNLFSSDMLSLLFLNSILK